MSLSRRTFIRQAACAALGTTSIASTVWNLRAINSAYAQTGGGDTDFRALICLFLYGGNDANNLLVPRDSAGYASYAATRGVLALPQASLLPITPATSDGRAYGLHPSVPELAALFNTNKKLAILANVGTLVAPVTRANYLAGTAALPPQLFSHADQSVQWQTSWPDTPPATGWGGRMADLLISLNGSAQVSMSISLAGTNTFQVGNQVFQYQVSPWGTIGLNDQYYPSGTTRMQAVQQMLNLPRQNLFEAEFAKITNRAIANNALLSTVLPGITINTPFPSNNYLASQLQMIARLIAARGALGMKRQIFFCAVGGYDTHGDELDAHAGLLTELSQGMNAFYQATVELGVADRVTTFTASDFGRTYATNGSGSDHGWGNHQLVMGGAVKGGDIYGTVPTLQVEGPDDTDEGRWIPTTSVDEYSATLAKWFGVTAGNLSAVLPNIGRFARPDLGFML